LRIYIISKLPLGLNTKAYEVRQSLGLQFWLRIL